MTRGELRERFAKAVEEANQLDEADKATVLGLADLVLDVSTHIENVSKELTRIADALSLAPRSKEQD